MSKVSELSRLLSVSGDLVRSSVPGGTEKIAGCGLLEGGSVPRLLLKEQFLFNPPAGTQNPPKP